jgi:hypothetical protein
MIRNAEVVPGLGIIRLEAHGLPEGFHGLPVTAQNIIRNAEEKIPGLGKIRLEAHGLPAMLPRPSASLRAPPPVLKSSLSKAQRRPSKE